MKRIALIQSGKVVNLVAWDGVTPFNPSATMVEVIEGERCSPGDSYDPTRSPRFVAPD